MLPGDLAGEAGKRVFTERADAADLVQCGRSDTATRSPALSISLARCHGRPARSRPSRVPGQAVGGLLNVLQAACDWQVPRVGIASTVGVYGGVTADPPPYREDVPFPMISGHVIQAFKKIGELLAATCMSAMGSRSSATGSHPGARAGTPSSPFTAVPQLVHGAARGTAPGLLRPALTPSRR